MPQAIMLQDHETLGGRGTVLSETEVAAPAFKKIMQFALTSQRVPPTGTKPVIYPLSVP